MTIRIAACSCGQLAAHVSSDPVRVSVCHCLACQRRTGSVFAAQARFLGRDVVLSGEATVYTRVGDEGGSAAFHFCPVCGATVYYVMEGLETFVMIPVGAFADPAFPGPQVSVYEERMHTWVAPPAGAEHIR